MSIKVLVFESDSALAGELRNELGNLGCAVRVVDDGNVGLQQAQAERPDLILLSIELPRMNGFSVCNKLKKDPDLKEVPLIIMSSESSDETFEQHKKLRTRAEAYVHKPIAFAQLLQEIEAFVTLGGDALASTGDTGDADGIVIDEDEEGAAEPVAIERAPDSARTAMYQVPSMPQKQRQIDPDVDAFADDAFGRLQASGDEASAPPANVTESERPPPAARADLGATAGELDEANARASELEAQLNLAREEVERVREEALAEAARLKHDLEELRSRPVAAAGVKGGSVPPKGGSGVTSREFLDLRETLSKKDKEILALKQQHGAKDKELVESKERSLAHEGRVSELDDKVLAKDRELAEAAEKLEDLSGQHETAKKGLADTRTELDRVEKQLEELSAKRDQESVAHEAASAASRADHAAAMATLKADHAGAMATLKADHAGAFEAAATEHAESLVQADAAFRAETEATLAAHNAVVEEAARQHAAALAQKQAEAEQQRTAALAEREETARVHAELVAQKDAEAEEQKAAALAAQEEAAREHAAALTQKGAEGQEQKAAALAALEARLKAETDAKLAALHRAHTEEQERLRAEGDGRESALKDELAQTKARVEEIERQHRDLSLVRTALDSQLGASTVKVATLEEELTALRGKLDDTEKGLARESSRASRAFAKWDADKASLERAKDALAVALAQLDEAEARPISE